MTPFGLWTAPRFVPPEEAIEFLGDLADRAGFKAVARPEGSDGHGWFLLEARFFQDLAEAATPR